MRKLIIFVICCILVVSNGINSYAAENNEQKFYVVINDEEIVFEGDNYVNPETGEYFYWKDASRGTDKTFEFKIRYSVQSSSFTIAGSSAIVRSMGEIKDFNGNVLSAYTSQRYEVGLSGASSASFEPLVGYQTSYLFNAISGGSYRVTIRNPIDLRNVDAYLEGYGSITSN